MSVNFFGVKRFVRHLVTVGLALSLVSYVNADDTSAEEELFGGSEEQLIFNDSSLSAPTHFNTDSIVALFGQKLDEEDSRLDIGGRYYHSSFLLQSEKTTIGESTIAHRGVVDIYFDAQLEDDVRFFYQQKIVQSFNGDENPILLFLSQFRGSSPVDQLWLKFKIDDKYYVTLGKQPTKWGSGLVWQPTDFLNAQKLNPLDLVDQRLGVSLLKMEYPITNKGINLYGVIQLNDATQLQDLGWLWRAELLTGLGEYAISFAAKNNDALKAGFDMSRGWGPIDFRVDLALVHDDHQPFYEGGFSISNGLFIVPRVIDRRDEWMSQISTGFLYSRSFRDNYNFLLTMEYFYNEVGYENSDLVSWAIINSLLPNGSSFSPLYFSQQYFTLGSTVTGLGADKDVSVNLLVINNVSDGSGVLQGVYSMQPYRDLSVSLSAGWFFGGDGTFRPDVELLNSSLLEGVNLSLPRYSAEIQLTVKF